MDYCYFICLMWISTKRKWTTALKPISQWFSSYYLGPNSTFTLSLPSNFIRFFTLRVCLCMCVFCNAPHTQTYSSSYLYTVLRGFTQHFHTQKHLFLPCQKSNVATHTVLTSRTRDIELGKIFPWNSSLSQILICLFKSV